MKRVEHNDPIASLLRNKYATVKMTETKILKVLLAIQEKASTGPSLKAQFGLIKMSIKALKGAGCITVSSQAIGEIPYRVALYTATGVPYTAKVGRPMKDVPVLNREAYRKWAAQNSERRKSYQKAYYAEKLSAAARLRAKTDEACISRFVEDAPGLMGRAPEPLLDTHPQKAQ